MAAAIVLHAVAVTVTVTVTGGRHTIDDTVLRVIIVTHALSTHAAGHLAELRLNRLARVAIHALAVLVHDILAVVPISVGVVVSTLILATTNGGED